LLERAINKNPQGLERHRSRSSSETEQESTGKLTEEKMVRKKRSPERTRDDRLI
jgi:hypothetical protein